MLNEEAVKKICDLYKKEREYQTCAHGDYQKVESLNLGSFILLIERYLEKAKECYCGPWTNEMPPWLYNCRENVYEGYSPAEAYEELIKVFALTGATLEIFTDINLDEWRKNIEEDLKKWKKE